MLVVRGVPVPVVQVVHVIVMGDGTVAASVAVDVVVFSGVVRPVPLGIGHEAVISRRRGWAGPGAFD